MPDVLEAALPDKSQIKNDFQSIQSSPFPNILNNDTVYLFYHTHEQYIGRNIQLSDAKCGAVFLVLTAVIGGLLSDKNFRLQIHGFAFNPLENILLSEYGTIAAFTTFILCSISLCAAFFSILPRGISFSRRSTGECSYTHKADLISFPAIACFGHDRDAEQFVNTMLSTDRAEISRQLLSHIHALSQICVTKLKWLKSSMYFGALGILASTVWLLIN